MNILIIGGNGFVGSHLVDYLLLKGHNVRVFDMKHEKFRKPNSNVDYRIFSMDDTNNLYEALLDIDIVFHLACSTVPSTADINPISDINNDVINTLKLLDLLVQLKIRRFVYFSSGGTVYGLPQKIPINEEQPLNPISTYGIIKVTIEHYIRLYERLYGINAIIVRPSNIYGPRQGHYIAQGVISTFLKKVFDNKNITVFGDGTSTKDYIYVSDFIKICYSLGISDKKGAFNIGSGIGISLIEIIDIIKRITNINPNIIYEGNKKYDVSKFILDISKTMKAQSQKPETGIETGIEKVWNWISHKN